MFLQGRGRPGMEIQGLGFLNNKGGISNHGSGYGSVFSEKKMIWSMGPWGKYHFKEMMEEEESKIKLKKGQKSREKLGEDCSNSLKGYGSVK